VRTIRRSCRDGAQRIACSRQAPLRRYAEGTRAAPSLRASGQAEGGPYTIGLQVRTQDASLKSLCYGVVRWILTGRVLAFADAELVFADLYVKRDGLGP
jgi:hypothetical protein